MEEWICTIREFANGLDYQRQFRDGRMLQALDGEGADEFKRLMTAACLTKEKADGKYKREASVDVGAGDKCFTVQD